LSATSPEVLRAWAPYKISLSGEHAVGYGGSSVVAALDAGVDLHAEVSAGAAGSFRSGDVSCPWTSDEAERFAAEVDEEFERRGPEAWRRWAGDFFAPFRYAVGAALGSNGLRPFAAVSSPPIWAGCGLGTSSASAASLIRICAGFSGQPLPAEELVARIRAVDRLCHGGMPSGVDGAVVVRGGALRFCRGTTVTLPAPELAVLLVHTGVERSCGDVISWFARTARRRLDRYVREMEEVTARVAAALAARDVAALVEGIEEDRRILQRHGLGHPRADELAGFIVRRGAAAAKLTGAGAGGALFGLFQNEVPREMIQELAARGVPARACRFGDRGVRLVPGDRGAAQGETAGG
jgi:mevalonate kinase